MASEVKSFICDDSRIDEAEGSEVEIKWDDTWHVYPGLCVMRMCTDTSHAEHPGQWLCSLVMSTTNMATFDPPDAPESLCACGTAYETELDGKKARVDP